ncbi:MAG TPA: 5'-nucleotidase C-terminal domain-containing protein, partial [Candidatus Hydrogenedens sp.]|nr:5'-nucleotidase C-terminal domain-containing protein [Candidatus Hydrogenedens sp.]
CKLKQISKSVEFVTTNFEEGLKACYKPWVVKKVGNFSVGFVGIVKLEGEDKEVAESAIPSVKKAIEEMKQQQNCHFFIALCHLGSQTCLNISKDLPEVSIFVSAHTHELIKNAKKSTETGALVVQAGSYTQYVGYLDFVLDTETQKIIDYKDKVVELNHNKIPMDKELMDFIMAREREVCPIASKFLIENNKTISSTQIAALSAQAMREYANADIALCNPSLLIRSALPATKLDYNALYLTAGQRAKDLLQVTLSGKQIEQYLVNLVKYHWGRTAYAGMEAEYKSAFPMDKVAVKTNLDPNKKYKVIMAQREFEKRLLRSLQKDNENIEEVKNTIQNCNFTFFDAVSKYVEEIREKGLSLDKYVNKMGIKNGKVEEYMEEDNNE